MRQNRVNPFGKIIAAPERGLWLGNRGVIHQNEVIVRSFKLKAWITCVLEFKNRKFEIMAPGRWTQLFFMDEATALAAGHRPCGECRRADFVRFKTHWIAGNPAYEFNNKTKIGDIDAVIHKERIDKQHQKITFLALPKDLPDGVFVQFKNEPYLVLDNKCYHWTAAGYGNSIPLPSAPVEVLTPKSVVNAIKAGYQPQINLSRLKDRYEF
jgi:hypothetical protein